MNLLHILILERAVGVEPHSVADSALNQLRRLSRRGPAPSCSPHERGSPLSQSPLSRVQIQRFHTCCHSRLHWSGRWELNPRQPAWKAGTLPLSYARLVMSSSGRQGFFRRAPGRASSAWWAGKDSNLGSRWQQIYSLTPLATWVPAQNFQQENSN